MARDPRVIFDSSDQIQMRGSLALWHTNSIAIADGYAPRVEVHVNIWRGSRMKKRNGYHFIDMGIRFEEFRSLKTLSICLPCEVITGDISDLFSVMNNGSTLSAIFNETLEVGDLLKDATVFEALNNENAVQFYVSRCDDSERDISVIGDGAEKCSVITITEGFFDRIRNLVGDHYIRLRIKLPIDAANPFITTTDPQDTAFLSTISSSETVEFRLNERRNFSPAIRERLRSDRVRLINISTVHYFLIRDMGVEMTQAHSSFKKMRRLEPDLWRKYLQNAEGFDPDRMIIYHWKTSSNPVDSFTALATFRAYHTGHLWLYAIVIILLGALGSAVQSVLSTLFEKFIVYISGESEKLSSLATWYPMLANFLIIILLSLILWGIVNYARGRKE